MLSIVITSILPVMTKYDNNKNTNTSSEKEEEDGGTIGST